MTLGHTKISYLERLWHPTTGCSFGCATCWARGLVCDRLSGTMKGLPESRTFGVGGRPADPEAAFAPTFHPDRLADPLKAHKPQVIGVSFLGDLFDAGITDEQIAAVFGVMAAAPQHTFVLLTKQAERMERWFAWLDRTQTAGHWTECHWHALRQEPGVDDYIASHSGGLPDRPWPLPNVWIGVSVTCQADADERILYLLRAPAAHRWVSAEPLVGPVNLTNLAPKEDWHTDALDCSVSSRSLSFVIAGGESGPKARPMDEDWMRSLRDQCASAQVPFYYKQNSGLHPEHLPLLDGVRHDALPWRIER